MMGGFPDDVLLQSSPTEYATLHDLEAHKVDQAHPDAWPTCPRCNAIAHRYLEGRTTWHG